VLSIKTGASVKISELIYGGYLVFFYGIDDIGKIGGNFCTYFFAVFVFLHEKIKKQVIKILSFSRHYLTIYSKMLLY